MLSRVSLTLQLPFHGSLANVIVVLREELEIAMQLVGITSLDQAHPGLLNTGDIDRYVNRGDDHPWARKIQRKPRSRL